MKLSLFFTRISRLPVLIACLAGFFAAAYFILPPLSTLMGTIDGNQVSPDTLFYYTGETLYDMARAYGEKGRTGYIRSVVTLDMIWPLIYVFTLSVSISFFGNIGFPPGSRCKRMNLIPLSAGIFDLLENVCVAMAMAGFPVFSGPIHHLAGIFTAAKWITAAASVLTLSSAAAAAGISLLRSRKVSS